MGSKTEGWGFQSAPFLSVPPRQDYLRTTVGNTESAGRSRVSPQWNLWLTIITFWGAETFPSASCTNAVCRRSKGLRGLCHQPQLLAPSHLALPSGLSLLPNPAGPVSSLLAPLQPPLPSRGVSGFVSAAPDIPNWEAVIERPCPHPPQTQPWPEVGTQDDSREPGPGWPAL